MNVFLSYAFDPWNAPIAARLRAVAAVYEISILLPDRTHVALNGLPSETDEKIRASDAVIALVTSSATSDAINLVNLELDTATRLGKPVIALVEDRVTIQRLSNSQVVRFDPLNPTAHEAALMNALDHIRRSKQNLAALGWIAGIAIGLVALGEFVSRDE